MILSRSIQMTPASVIYVSLFSAMIGLVLAPVFGRTPPSQPPATTAHHAMEHPKIEVDASNVPEVSLRVVKDVMSGWNVYVDVTRFVFAPEQVNQRNAPNEGHAHLYLNGEKLARLYGPAFHIGYAPKGENTVTVSLNANDHSDLTWQGKPIFAQASFIQQ